MVLRALVKHNNPNFLFLSESKETSGCIQLIAFRIGFHYYFMVEAIEGKGGLVPFRH